MERLQVGMQYPSGMLGIDTRALRATWTVFLFALLIYLVYLVRESILIFVAAFFFAYILSPVLDALRRVTPGRISRTAALAVVYVCLIGLIATVGTYLGGRLVEEASSLAARLPELIREHRDLSSIPMPSWLEPVRERLAEFIQSQLDTGAERILPLIQRAVGGVASIIGSLGFVILVPILTFLFLKDAEPIRESLLSWVPPKRRAFVDDLTQDIHVMLAQYIRALVILAILTSVAYIIFFEIIRLPYALLLSALAAPLELIPFIGPLIGTILILLVAAFTGYPHIWWIVIFFAAYRAFQDYFLQPFLMSSGVQLHPLLVIFGALAGQQLGGLWGMFLSVPVLATLRLVLVRVQRRRRQAELVTERG
jgi:predicted PurR-regulated permease PerM